MIRKTLQVIFFTLPPLLLFNCGNDKSNESIFPGCELPFNNLELIGESMLPEEIVSDNYQNFENIDSLNAFALELCDLGRHLVAQIVDNSDEAKFIIYNECGEEVANGNFFNNIDRDLENTLTTVIESELNTNIFILDLAIVNFSDGSLRYIAEIRENGEEPRYLLESDGTINCMLF